MDAADDVRAGDVEDLVAALETLEVVEAEVGRLQHRAHRPVGDDDALRERAQQRRSGGVIGHAARLPQTIGEGPELPCHGGLFGHGRLA